MVWGQAGFFSDPPLARNSRFALATRSPRFRLCSPEIRKKLRLFCRLTVKRNKYATVMILVYFVVTNTLFFKCVWENYDEVTLIITLLYCFCHVKSKGQLCVTRKFIYHVVQEFNFAGKIITLKCILALRMLFFRNFKLTQFLKKQQPSAESIANIKVFDSVTLCKSQSDSVKVLLATCTSQNMEQREMSKQWLSRKGFRPVSFLFRPVDLRFRLSQCRDAFESDKIM